MTELVDLRLSDPGGYISICKKRETLIRYNDDDREDGGGKYVIKRRSALCGVKPLKIM